MENFLIRASTAVSGAFDIHAVIVADEDEPIKVKRNRSSVIPIKEIKVKRNHSSTPSFKPIKETSACETRDDEQNAEQPTSPNKEVKGTHAALAKLITKLDKKELQIAKLKQQISKTEEEVADTKKKIRAIVTFGGALHKNKDQSDNVDAVLNDKKVDGDDKAVMLDSTSGETWEPKDQTISQVQ